MVLLNDKVEVHRLKESLLNLQIEVPEFVRNLELTIRLAKPNVSLTRI